MQKCVRSTKNKNGDYNGLDILKIKRQAIEQLGILKCSRITERICTDAEQNPYAQNVIRIE